MKRSQQKPSLYSSKTIVVWLVFWCHITMCTPQVHCYLFLRAWQQGIGYNINHKHNMICITVTPQGRYDVSNNEDSTVYRYADIGLRQSNLKSLHYRPNYFPVIVVHFNTYDIKSYPFQHLFQNTLYIKYIQQEFFEMTVIMCSGH